MSSVWSSYWRAEFHVGDHRMISGSRRRIQWQYMTQQTVGNVAGSQDTDPVTELCRGYKGEESENEQELYGTYHSQVKKHQRTVHDCQQF